MSQNHPLNFTNFSKVVRALKNYVIHSKYCFYSLSKFPVVEHICGFIINETASYWNPLRENNQTSTKTFQNIKEGTLLYFEKINILKNLPKTGLSSIKWTLSLASIIVGLNFWFSILVSNICYWDYVFSVFFCVTFKRYCYVNSLMLGVY